MQFFFLWEMCHVFLPHFCSLRSIQPHASEPIPTALGHVSALGRWWRWWGGQSTSANRNQWPELVKPGSVEIQPYLLCSNMEQIYIYIYNDFSCRFSNDFLPIHQFFFWNYSIFLLGTSSCILMGAREVDQPKVRLGAGLKGRLRDSNPFFLMCFFWGANLKFKSYLPKHECWNKPLCCEMVIFCLQVRHKTW